MSRDNFTFFDKRMTERTRNHIPNLHPMKSRLCYLLLLLGTVLIFDACKKEKIEPVVKNNPDLTPNPNPNPNPNPTGDARIEGYVRAANGVSPIGGAKVYTNANHTTLS